MSCIAHRSWLALVLYLGLASQAFALKVGWHDQMSIQPGDGVDLKLQSQPKGPPVVVMGTAPPAGSPNTGDSSETVTFAQHAYDMVRSLSINSSVSLTYYVFSGSMNVGFIDKTTFDANDLNFVFTATRNFGDRYYPVLGLSPDFKAIAANLQGANQGPALHSAITGIFGTHYVHGYQSAAMVSVVYTLHFSSKSEREQLSLNTSGGDTFGFSSFSDTINYFFSSTSTSRSISYRFYTTDPFQSPTNFNFSTSGNIQTMADFTNLVTRVEAYWRAMDPARAKVTGYILDPIETIPGYLQLLSGYAPPAAFPANYETFLQSYASLQLWSQRLTAWTLDPKRMNWLNSSAQQVAQGKSADVANYVATMQAIATNHFQTGAPLQVPDDIFNYLSTLNDLPIPAIYVLDSFDDGTASYHYVFGWIDCGSTNLTTPAPFNGVSELRDEADSGVFAPIVYSPADYQKNLLTQYGGVALTHAKLLLASEQWATLTNLVATQNRVGFFSARVAAAQAQDWSLAISDLEGNPVDEIPWLSTRAGGTPASIAVTNVIDVSLAVAPFPTNAVVGVPVTFTLTVTNEGGAAVYGLTVSFKVDSRFRFGSMSSSQGTGAFTPVNRIAAFSFGSLAAGAGADIAVQLTPLEAGWAVPATNAVLSLPKALANISTNTSAPFPAIQVGQPPSITTQPQSRLVYAGTSVTFTAAATGSPPLNYQWQLNSTNLHGATGPSLTLINVNPNQAGSYQVMVTNVLGAATSQVATLTILPGLQIIAGTGSGGTGSSVLLPISVTGFTNLLTAQFSLHWNPAVAQLIDVEQFGIGSLAGDNFGTNNAVKGALTFSWYDPTLHGSSLPDGTVLFAVRFNLVGKNGNTSIVSIDGNPTALEADNLAGTPVPLAASPGRVTVTDQIQITGRIVYYATGLPVPGVTLALGGTSLNSVKTGGDGTFAFTVSAGGNYTMTPGLTNDAAPSRGLTALDLVLIRRHILGVSLLDSPYKVIAADVTGAQSITTLDIALIQRVILGITNAFPGGILWRFIPADETFSDPQHPWPFNTNLTFATPNTSQIGQDFVALKLGDVRSAWTPAAVGLFDSSFPAALLRTNGAVPKTDSAANVTFAVGNTNAIPGDTVTVPVRVSRFSSVTSVQFTLDWNTNALAFAGLGDYGLPALDVNNFGLIFTNAGHLTFSWNDPSVAGVSVPDGTMIFTLQFLALSAAQSESDISLGDVPTPRQVTIDLNPVNLTSQNGAVQVTAATTPVIRSPRRNGDAFSFPVSTVPGRSHVLEYKDSLADPAWTPLQTLPGTGGVVVFTDPAATSPARYYRVRAR